MVVYKKLTGKPLVLQDLMELDKVCFNVSSSSSFFNQMKEMRKE
jgi:hypothetical protein